MDQLPLSPLTTFIPFTKLGLCYGGSREAGVLLRQLRVSGLDSLTQGTSSRSLVHP